MSKKALWMRYVNFNKIKDLLMVVSENSGNLRAKDLEEIGIKEGILINESGTAMTHSTRYHYRKVMEHLNLIQLKNGKYQIGDEEIVLSIIDSSQIGDDYSPKAEETFSKVIINNDDCRKYYFDYFMDKPEYDLNSWRCNSKKLLIETKVNSPIYNDNTSVNPKHWVKVSNLEVGKEMILSSYDEISAILWGVRMWSNNLHLTDEFMLSTRTGRVVFSVKDKIYKEKSLEKSFCNLIESADFRDEIIEISVPLLVTEIAYSAGTTIANAKQFLINLKKKISIER